MSWLTPKSQGIRAALFVMAAAALICIGVLRTRNAYRLIDEDDRTWGSTRNAYFDMARAQTPNSLERAYLEYRRCLESVERVPTERWQPMDSVIAEVRLIAWDTEGRPPSHVGALWLKEMLPSLPKPKSQRDVQLNSDFEAPFAGLSFFMAVVCIVQAILAMQLRSSLQAQDTNRRKQTRLRERLVDLLRSFQKPT